MKGRLFGLALACLLAAAPAVAQTGPVSVPTQSDFDALANRVSTLESAVQALQPAPAPAPAPTPDPTPTTTSGHPYYDALLGRADLWKAYSLRDDAQLDLYKAARSIPRYVTYDYANDPDPRKQDAAKIVIPDWTNSLQNQVLLPFGSEEGHAYLVTWDAWYGREAVPSVSGLQNWKTFQFDYPRSVGGRATIWMEVQTRFDQAQDGMVGRVRTRQYSTLAADPVPTDANFQIAPETWTRYWAYLEIPPFGSGDVLLTLYASDRNRAPVLIHNKTPWRRDVPGRIEKFWLEYNTSTDAVAPGRGPMTEYARNLVILRDPADLPLSQAGL